MQLHQLTPKNRRTTARRIGRGGKRGKTSGKGGKGQTARAGGRPRPELRDMIKRLPKRRGFGKNRALTVNNERVRPYVVNVSALNIFSDGDTVNPKVIVARGILEARDGREVAIKVLGTGELSKKLTISGCTVSAAARTKIEAKGGSVA
jgi:large subunit ribosomal protein L15